MTKHASRKTGRAESKKATAPTSHDHASEMVAAQQRAAEDHRAQAAKMTSFRRHGSPDGVDLPAKA